MVGGVAGGSEDEVSRVEVAPTSATAAAEESVKGICHLRVAIRGRKLLVGLTVGRQMTAIL